MKLSHRANKAAAPLVARIDTFVAVTQAGARKRAWLVVAVPVIAGFALMAASSGSEHWPLWAVLGAAFSWVLATVLVDTRTREAGQTPPVCACRRGALAVAAPAGAARTVRLLVGLASMAAAYGSLLVDITPLTLAFIWLGLSWLAASRSGYPGRPETGALASAVVHRRVATGCGVMCEVDHRIAGLSRPAR